MGPTAQAFHAAFALGDNDQSSSHIDANDVALAASEGLSTKLIDKDQELKELHRALGLLTVQVPR
jgi:hypothetical protein